jgi:hypothetical protein
MPKQQFIDYNFNRGWNTDFSDIMVVDEELILADNAEIMNRGGIKKRFGVETLNSTSYNAKVHQIIEWPRKDGSVELLAIIGSDLCSIAADGSKTVIQALNNTFIPHFSVMDKFYFIDQGTEYYVYDGSTCSAVTANPDSSNDLAPIRRCKFAFYHSESMRIFFAGDSQDKEAVYYSEYNDPTFVKTTSVIYPSRAEGEVKALKILMDAIIVGYRYGNWIWRGLDPEQDAIWEKLPTSHGPINGDCFTITTNSLSMVSNGGIFSLSPSIIGVPMETEVGQNYITNLAKNRVMEVIKSITDKNKVRTVFNSDTGKYLIAYCDDGTGVNNNILIFDWEGQAFSRYKGLNVNDFCLRQNGDLLIATENHILKMKDDSTEDIDSTGAAKIIDFDIKTPKYNFNEPFRRKKITHMFVIFKNFGEAHELDVKLYIDEEVKHQFTVKGDNTGTEIITHREKTHQVGNNFQVEIINNQYSEVEIYGIGFYYQVANTGGDKVEY